MVCALVAAPYIAVTLSATAISACLDWIWDPIFHDAQKQGLKSRSYIPDVPSSQCIAIDPRREQTVSVKGFRTGTAADAIRLLTTFRSPKVEDRTLGTVPAYVGPASCETFDRTVAKVFTSRAAALADDADNATQIFDTLLKAQGEYARVQGPYFTDRPKAPQP